MNAKFNGAQAITSLERAAMQIRAASRAALRAGIDAAVVSERSTNDFRDRSGKTRRSIVGRMQSDVRGFVRAGGVAKFLHEGTRAHIIVASGRSLKFQVGGTTLFRKMVRHPGTKPRDFVRRAREVGELTARSIIEELLRSVLS